MPAEISAENEPVTLSMHLELSIDPDLLDKQIGAFRRVADMLQGAAVEDDRELLDSTEQLLRGIAAAAERAKRERAGEEEEFIEMDLLDVEITGHQMAQALWLNEQVALVDALARASKNAEDPDDARRIKNLEGVLRAALEGEEILEEFEGEEN